MAIMVLDVGAVEFLRTYLNNYRPVEGNDLTLRLFVNDVTPSQTGITYTQAAGGGYLPITLTNGLWTVTEGNNPPDAVYTQQIFVFTGPLTTNTTVFGHYITDAAGTIICADRFGTSFIPANNGDNIKITPRLQASSGTPN